MKRLRLWVRAYFGFSRMETNAFLVMIPLVLLLLFAEPLLHAIKPQDPLPNPDRTDSLMIWLQTQAALVSERMDTIAFHPFDPNTISEEELVAWQLDLSTASRIVRYRNNGGRFRKAKDLLKIFGMDTNWYRRASPWISIAVQDPPAVKFTSRKKTTLRQDINTADTLMLQDVYGIGPAFARRIVKFRERLGGFVSIDQLREVYGLDSLVVKRISMQFEVREGFQPRVLILSQASMEDLSYHPYINRRQAQAIILFRAQHGGIDSLGQLKAIPVLGEPWINKMKPYVRVGDLSLQQR